MRQTAKAILSCERLEALQDQKKKCAPLTTPIEHYTRSPS